MAKLNCKNRSVFIGDNREVMLGLNSEIADAIITDPPFNSGQTLEDCQAKSVSKTPDGVPLDKHGKPTRGFGDKWKITDLKKEEIEMLRYKCPHLLEYTDFVRHYHSAGMEAYLMMMASRLVLCHEILKETGSLFLHCDSSANNYLRTILDIIFGEKNFRNEIVWCYNDTPGRPTRWFARKHDTILFYVKDDKKAKFYGDNVRIPIKPESVKRYQTPRKLGGKSYVGGASIEKGKIPEDFWLMPSLKKNSPESTGKPTQKKVELYKRLIKAVTNPGDLVIDPFCGCATTIVAAEKLGRQWIGMDINPTTEELVIDQLNNPHFKLEQTFAFWKKEVHIIKKRGDFPQRTDNKISKKQREELIDKLLAAQARRKGCSYCEICERPRDHYDLDVDHIHPRSNRGEWKLENLQLACGRCNGWKSNIYTNDEVRARLRRDGLLWHQIVATENYKGTLGKRKKNPRRKADSERKKASGQMKIL